MQGALHDTLQEIRCELVGGITDARLALVSILDLLFADTLLSSRPNLMLAAARVSQIDDDGCALIPNFDAARRQLFA